jgi:hypothetical protein
MSEEEFPDFVTTSRMFVSCGKCGKDSDWVVEFAQPPDNFWFQPQMICGDCQRKILEENR